jgi:hypothetical protein
MSGSAQDGRVFDDEGDHSVGNDDDHYAPSAGTALKAISKGHGRPQSMDESGRGPRRAVAEAVASPLGVQSGINSTVVSSSKRPAARVKCSYKSYALRPVLRPCLTVRQRRCHSPKVDDGELQKAAPEASLTGPSGHRFLHHINSC